MTEGWRGLRSIDQALGLPKGSAFRAFKLFAGNWREGQDFRVLDHALDLDTINQLKLSHEVYASSIKAVILSPACAAELSAYLARNGRSGN